MVSARSAAAISSIEKTSGWETADRIGSCFYEAWELARVRADVAAACGQKPQPPPVEFSVGAAGSQAYIDGLGEKDCPHKDDYDNLDYWKSSAAKRLMWLEGFNGAARANFLAAHWRKR